MIPAVTPHIKPGVVVSSENIQVTARQNLSDRLERAIW